MLQRSNHLNLEQETRLKQIMNKKEGIIMITLDNIM